MLPPSLALQVSITCYIIRNLFPKKMILLISCRLGYLTYSAHVFCILKPIFHCDAKPFTLGTFASPNAKDSTLRYLTQKIPTCWYLLRWVTQIFHVTQRKTPNASQWNMGCVGSQMQISCIGHVHFIVLV